MTAPLTNDSSLPELTPMTPPADSMVLAICCADIDAAP